MKYFFKPDWLVISISIILLASIAMLVHITPWNSFWSIIFFALMIGILAYGLAIMPIWVEVDDKKIKVQQLIGFRIFRKDKVKIHQVKKEDLKGSIRVFGSSGYGGHTGWFRNKKLGKYFMLILNKKELALIETEKGRKIVINYPQRLFEQK